MSGRTGYPLLAEMPLAGIGTALRAAAETLIPLLAVQDVVRPHEAKLRAFFLDAAQGPEAPVALAEAVLNETAESAESVGKIAAHLDIPVQVLLFAFSFMPGACPAGPGGAVAAREREGGSLERGRCLAAGLLPCLRIRAFHSVSGPACF